jgi:hypothetical protein
MNKFAQSALAALIAVAAAVRPAVAQVAATTDPVGYIRVRVLAQPDDLVLLFLAPSLGSPIPLPGFQGLLALDPSALVCMAGAPVDSLGISDTLLPNAWLGCWLQAGIRSPRDPASGQLQSPRRLLPPAQ